MGFLTPFFYDLVTNPFSALLLLSGWQITVYILNLIFGRFNNPVVNGLLSSSIMVGGGFAGLVTKQTWAVSHHSYEHLNNPIFNLARKIGISITLIIFFLLIGILFSNIFTFLLGVTETIMMFGTFGIVLAILFWSCIGIIISNLFR